MEGQPAFPDAPERMIDRLTQKYVDGEFGEERLEEYLEFLFLHQKDPTQLSAGERAMCIVRSEVTKRAENGDRDVSELKAEVTPEQMDQLREYGRVVHQIYGENQPVHIMGVECVAVDGLESDLPRVVDDPES